MRLPGEIVPPSLMTSPPMVPLPATVPCWILTVPPPASVKSLRIATVPVPVLVSVRPIRSSVLLNVSVDPLETSAVASASKLTTAWNWWVPATLNVGLTGLVGSVVAVRLTLAKPPTA